jgi:hypothetical protein
MLLLNKGAKMKNMIKKTKTILMTLCLSAFFMVDSVFAWEGHSATTSTDSSNFGSEFWVFFQDNIMQGAFGSIIGVGGVLVCIYFIGRTMIPQAFVTAIAVLGFYKAEALATALGMCF